MNAGAPTCAQCGGLNTNPQQMQCRFCGQALVPAAPQGYGAPQAYGAPQGYGAPQAYGAPQGYGAPPPGYGAPPPGYGGPQPNAYGAPPNPYGGPQPNPYGQGQYPVQGFGGVQPFNQYGAQPFRSSGWTSGWSTFFWVRLVIAMIAISISLLGACISAISH